MSLEENNLFDVIIVGGGITGIGIFRDLSFHGVSCLLLEKGEFCNETSAKSSKMLHGGIRYLEQLDFSLVRDALQEKDLWLKLAPKYCYSQKFYLPLYQDSKHSPLLIRLGMFLYSKILSRNKTMGGFEKKKKVLDNIPELKKQKLKGAGVYSDAIMDDKGLGEACLIDTIKKTKGKALDQTEVLTIKDHKNHYQVQTNKGNYQAKFVVMATGPFTDQVAKKLISPNWKDIMVPSKGIHLWLKKEALKLKSSVVLVTKDDRVIFVIPREEGILVGTTDEFIEKDFKDVKPSQKEIDYLVKEVNNYFPKAKVTPDEILSSYAGVRPLVKDPHAKRAGDVSRHHQVLRPKRNFFVIAGGKYTTFRLMAQDIARPICRLLGINYDENKALRELKE